MIALILRILALYELPIETDLILTNLRDGTIVELSNIERASSASDFNGMFIVSRTPMDFDFDGFYGHYFTGSQAMDASIPVETEKFEKVLKKAISGMSNYGAYVFLYSVAERVIRSIIDGERTLFISCFPLLLKSASLFKGDLMETVLSEIFTTMWGDKMEESECDKVTRPFVKMTTEKDDEMQRFADFLVQIVYDGDLSMGLVVRNALGVYCPSYYVILVVTIFTERLYSICSPSVAFRLVSDVFKDKWMYLCFTDEPTKFDFMYHRDHMDMFPYVGARFGMEQALRVNRIPSLLSYYVSQMQSHRNVRFVKAIAQPVFLHCFEIAQGESVTPVLIVSEEAMGEIKQVYVTHKTLLRNACSFSEVAQIKLLDTLLNIWVRYGFEPKGFFYANVAIMVNNEIFDEPFISNWLQKSTIASKYIESLMIELNCLVVSRISNHPHDPVSRYEEDP